MEWSKLFYVLGALFAAWLLYHSIKNNPQAFSSDNLSKSFFTVGILALLLIGFIAILVLFLRR